MACGLREGLLRPATSPREKDKSMRAVVRLSSHQRSVIEAHAQSMRHRPTRSEEMLFRALSSGKVGVVFRRQYRVGRYVADFAAPAAKLAVEVDGFWHASRRAADERRDRAFRTAGWRVVRIEAETVERDVERAVERVREAVAACAEPEA